MMDEEDSQVPIWSYRVNLDKRVRDDHPLRRIRAALDLSFVRKEVAHTYGRRGNKSVPPEVIVRMMLLLFLDDIKSERELMRIIPELPKRRLVLAYWPIAEPPLLPPWEGGSRLTKTPLVTPFEP